MKRFLLSYLTISSKSKMLLWLTLGTYKLFCKPYKVICKLGKSHRPILYLSLSMIIVLDHLYNKVISSLSYYRVQLMVNICYHDHIVGFCFNQSY